MCFVNTFKHSVVCHSCHGTFGMFDSESVAGMDYLEIFHSFLFHDKMVRRGGFEPPFLMTIVQFVFELIRISPYGGLLMRLAKPIQLLSLPAHIKLLKMLPFGFHHPNYLTPHSIPAQYFKPFLPKALVRVTCSSVNKMQYLTNQSGNHLFKRPIIVQRTTKTNCELIL